MLETALYPTVKRFLAELGFQVKGEVNGCDIVAVRDGAPPRLAIVERKQRCNNGDCESRMLPHKKQSVQRHEIAPTGSSLAPCSPRLSTLRAASGDGLR